ncbi:arginine utilization regulatory protein [Dethiosulfatibacter aminovorans DSM 17477]|uniref:Arginine utilization regulatory protein n=1 Tax=Dethiosulfatibacter aminovorans DSM 17477 TaxID=1121476 RepID=A0A1M6L4B1_9FIRM|nr:sigma 54-interacting transcriptional regulator [Dethiosulfatibacter aminovorans]SHJ66030.1 arginine utilization regulatory protein [Dethiosulfatibacter aminovorans DSM 17477]
MDYKKILELVTDNIDDGIFVVNKNGEVIFYNESADNQAGVSMKNAIGKHILDIFPKLTEKTSTILRVLKTGTPIVGDIQEYYNHNHKKVTILSTSYPIIEDGEIVGVVEVAKDMIKYGDFNEKIDKIRNNKGKKISNEEIIYSLNSILGESDKILEIKEKIKKVAKASSPVLVWGETGTGKELAVQSIHNCSKRKNKPFITQNCAAIPVTLLEGILFGTSLGSFTGSKDSPGLFELADGGTLFLDEINSMDITLQAKLLRVIQDGYIRRIGDKKTRKVDVRVIAAMNMNPVKALEEKKIREDLFYRINVLNMEMPPLRERREDISILADYFMKEMEYKTGREISGLSEDVYEFFNAYDWPGNIRELKHVIEHGVIMSTGEEITLKDMPVVLNEKRSTIEKSVHEETIGIGEIVFDKPLKSIVNDYEKQVIEKALKEKDYSINETSSLLNIPRQTLHYKMKNLGISIKKTL